MSKKIGGALLGIIVLGAIWYFLIKKEDYQVNFKVASTIGTVNQSIKSWNSSLNDPQPVTQNGLNELLQTIKLDDSTHYYRWKLTKENSSTVSVKLLVTDSARSLKNKFDILLGGNDFTENTKKRAKDFLDLLDSHLKKTRVKVVGEAETPEVFTAYISLESTQITKAKGMMEHINLLSNFIVQNKLEPKGTPFVEITHWDKKTDRLNFDFCFPIVKKDSLPSHHLIKYKQTASHKAIKAIYNGNYITSDRAWYAIEEYAEEHQIAVSPHIFEVFHNNPNMGGDELNWKAEIYMELKE